MTGTGAKETPLARARRLATGGTAIVAGGVLATNLLRIASSMILTRLLDASAFGVVGIIISVAFVFVMLSDIGLLPFLIRHEREDGRFLDEVWTLRVLRSAGLTLVMLLLSAPIARFMGKPELALVLAVWSVNFLIDGLSSLSFATAVRYSQIGRLSLLELIVGVVQLILSVILALAFRSYWALVAAMLIGSMVKLILSYALFPGQRRRWAIAPERARELWAFSRDIALSSLLQMLILQADKIVLARLLPLASYGLYAIAATLAAAPLAITYPYTQRILYPAYAHAARIDPASLPRLFYAKRRWPVLGYMAAVGGMIGTAPLIVELLYDPRYRAVAPYLQWLLLMPLVRMPNMAAEQALIALGQVRAVLHANICRTLWLFGVGVLAFASGGVMALVAAVGAVELAATPCYWWYLRRARILDVRQEMLGALAALGGGAIGWAVAKVALAWIV